MASGLEIVVVVAALAGAAMLVLRASRGEQDVPGARGAPPARASRRAPLALIGVMIAVTGASASAFGRRHVAPAPPPATPKTTTASTYVSSAACRACHPGEHASFGRTFHRTMTSRATPESVLAPLDGRALGTGRHVARLERRGEAVWATLPDPDALARAVLAGASASDVADVERQVVLTTGSHREQAFWVAGERVGELRLFPFVWLVAERRFVPRTDAFLTPPDEPLPPARWNSNCIACHAVAGEPGHDLASDAFDTRVAELGVACEACHGPGAAHVAAHRDPVARYMQYASKRPDPTIVHPARLSPERSAAVCGQCHAYSFPRDEDAFWATGYARSFRPGDALEPSRFVLSPDLAERTPSAPRIEAEAASLFWPDGTIRVGGRELNALVLSPCYARGQGDRKMTCLSCHAMHAGDPAGQIGPDHAGDAACTHCHDDAKSRTHGHHLPGSVGSACVGCHMPKTSYALLSAVRSHRIESPSAAASLATGKPNACNLCHLDRTLAWTAEKIEAWYGAPPVNVEGERRTTPEGVFLALAGDAAVRVLVADALGTKEARLAAGEAGGFARPILEELRRDPYAAVRFVAERSLRGLPASPAAENAVDPTRFAALRAMRDDRAITIAE